MSDYRALFISKLTSVTLSLSFVLSTIINPLDVFHIFIVLSSHNLSRPLTAWAVLHA